MGPAFGIRELGAVTVIDLPRQVTGATEAPVLLEQIRSAVASGRNKILLNLRELTYIDSAGIGTIVAAVTEAICAKCNARFCEGKDRVCPKCGTDPRQVRPKVVWISGISKPPWGELKLLAVPRKVRELLQIIRLESMFEFFDDELAALRAFGK